MWQHPASGPPPRIGMSFSATPSGCLNLFSWRTGTNPFSSLIFSGHNERDTPMLGIVPKMEHVDDLSHPRYHSCVLPWTGVRKKTFNQFLDISPIDSSSVGGLKCLWVFQPYLGWWSPMTMFQMSGSTTNQLFIGEPPKCITAEFGAWNPWWCVSALSNGTWQDGSILFDLEHKKRFAALHQVVLNSDRNGLYMISNTPNMI